MSWLSHSSLRRSIVWFAVAIGLIVLANVVVISISASNKKLTTRIDNVENVVKQCAQLSILLNTLDASDRGFAYSKDPEFLVTAKAAIEGIREISSSTLTFAENDPAATRAEASLRGVLVKRIAFSESLSRLTGAAGIQTLQSISPELKRGAIQEKILSVSAINDRLLPSLRETSKAAGGVGVLFYLFGVLTGIVILCLVVPHLVKELASLQSAQRGLTNENRVFQEIMDNTTVAVTIRDLEGRYVLANMAALQFMGKERKEVVGKTTREVVPPEAAEVVEKLLQQVANTGEPHESLVENPVTRGGQTFSAVFFPLKDAEGVTTGVGSVATDVSPIRRAQRAAEQALDDAERSKLMAEEASRLAETANHAKTEFLSRMSHELRTPMNAILGFTQILQLGSLNADQAEATDHILRGGKHLLNLINEVLDISRIETRDFSLSLEPIGLAQAVGEACDIVGPIAVKMNATIVNEIYADSTHVLADGQRLRQVLMNLIANAVKYGPVGGTVVVRAAETDGQLTIDVIDEGDGIPPEKIERLFEPFERLGADASLIEGTGLGLTLSKSLMQAMGGTITYSRTASGGSVFSIGLPVASVAILSEAAVATRTSGGHSNDGSLCVLYVEDNLSNVKLIETIFDQRPDVRLLVAMQGRLGIELAREHKPDLIVLDLHLPDIEGDQVLAAVKGDKQLQNIPVIILSADATDRRIKSLLRAGAHCYLTKPLQVEEFLAAVDLALFQRMSSKRTG